MTVAWTLIARQDLRALRAYIAQDDPDAVALRLKATFTPEQLGALAALVPHANLGRAVARTPTNRRAE